MEKVKPIDVQHEWGHWNQTIQEVHVNINLPLGTSAKEVSVSIKEDELECKFNGSAEYLLKVL